MPYLHTVPGTRPLLLDTATQYAPPAFHTACITQHPLLTSRTTHQLQARLKLHAQLARTCSTQWSKYIIWNLLIAAACQFTSVPLLLILCN